MSADSDFSSEVSPPSELSRTSFSTLSIQNILTDEPSLPLTLQAGALLPTRIHDNLKPTLKAASDSVATFAHREGHLSLSLGPKTGRGRMGTVHDVVLLDESTGSPVEWSTLKLPPLVVKIASVNRNTELAKEAWFYDQLKCLQGVTLARCYGFFQTKLPVQPRPRPRKVNGGNRYGIIPWQLKKCECGSVLCPGWCSSSSLKRQRARSQEHLPNDDNDNEQQLPMANAWVCLDPATFPKEHDADPWSLSNPNVYVRNDESQPKSVSSDEDYSDANNNTDNGQTGANAWGHESTDAEWLESKNEQDSSRDYSDANNSTDNGQTRANPWAQSGKSTDFLEWFEEEEENENEQLLTNATSSGYCSDANNINAWGCIDPETLAKDRDADSPGSGWSLSKPNVYQVPPKSVSSANESDKSEPIFIPPISPSMLPRRRAFEAELRDRPESEYDSGDVYEEDPDLSSDVEEHFSDSDDYDSVEEDDRWEWLENGDASESDSENIQVAPYCYQRRYLTKEERDKGRTLRTGRWRRPKVIPILVLEKFSNQLPLTKPPELPLIEQGVRNLFDDFWALRFHPGDTNYKHIFEASTPGMICPNHGYIHKWRVIDLGFGHFFKSGARTEKHFIDNVILTCIFASVVNGEP